MGEIRLSDSAISSVHAASKGITCGVMPFVSEWQVSSAATCGYGISAECSSCNKHARGYSQTRDPTAFLAMNVIARQKEVSTRLAETAVATSADGIDNIIFPCDSGVNAHMIS